MGFFKSRETGEQLRSVGAIGSVGLSFVVAIVMGTWGGRVLDRWLGTAPFLFILGFFLGLAAGVLNVYRTVSRAFPPSRPAAATAATTHLDAARPATPPSDDLGPGDE